MSGPSVTSCVHLESLCVAADAHVPLRLELVTQSVVCKLRVGDLVGHDG